MQRVFKGVAVDLEYTNIRDDYNMRAEFLIAIFIRFFQTSNAGEGTTINTDSVPTTNEKVTIYILRGGEPHRYVIFSADPADDDISSLTYMPENELMLEEGDQIIVDYPNTDTLNVAVTVQTRY